MRIFTYISGNLAAETMAIVINHLPPSKYEVFQFTDRYLPEVLDSLGLSPRVISMDEESLMKLLPGYNFILTSIRSPGSEERNLIRVAKKLGLPILVILADIGTGAAKFRDDLGWALPTIISVSDSVTHKSLIEGGIPKEIIYALGSPYIDDVASKNIKLDEANKNRIGYFAVPNTLDFKTWGIKKHYTENEVMRTIRESLQSFQNTKLVVRLHPKEYHEHAYDQFTNSQISVEPLLNRSATEDFINNNGIILSTYSTALLIAKFLGRPTISIQPDIGPIIRNTLYEEYSIPIVRSADELSRVLKGYIHKDPARTPISFLYNKAKSVTFLEDLITYTTLKNEGKNK